jgi:NAD(P)-dependent dehydrogenase (short-subunit alcohol dehydrogenase family)
MNLSEDLKGKWALILGGSSGFGLATAKRCAEVGMNVAIVHRDRKGAMEKITPEFNKIIEAGVQFLSFNCDALSKDEMANVIFALKNSGVSVHLLMHSIAFGNLKGIVPGEEAYLEDEDFTRTIYSMGTSMLTWTQELWKANLLHKGSQIIGMTSEGNEVAWKKYAAVSAAKVALEAISRSIAVEFGPHGVRSNIIQPGVTDTPALRLIPGFDAMQDRAIKKNPLGRFTMPDDVAKFIVLMCSSWASWVNGEVIRVDGGERIA